LLLRQIARNLLSILVIVILTVSMSMGQNSTRLLRLDAETAQKLQSLFDEDSLTCVHRVSLQQEQKQLSNRALKDERLPRLHPVFILANFDLTVPLLPTREQSSRYSRAPPDQLTENT